MSYAVLFPGQGSQFVGMGADMFDAKPELLGDGADEVLGFSLRNMCLNGPEEALTRTEHAQPALYATAFALWSELESRLSGRPAGAAGHSLGEYTALAAAGALEFFDGLALVAQRGRAIGLLHTAGDLGSAIGPPAAYALMPWIGLRGVYLLCAGLFAAGLALAVLFRPHAQGVT